MASTVGTPPNGSPSRTVLRERALKHCSSVLFTSVSRKLSTSSEVGLAPSGAGSTEYTLSISGVVGLTLQDRDRGADGEASASKGAVALPGPPARFE